MSWEPLHAGDPFPADPAAIETYAADVTATAQLIAEQVASLRRLADANNWTTDTADAFRERATDTANEIEKTHGRYAGVGTALTTLSGELQAHEASAKLKVQEAAQLVRTIQANPEVSPTPGEDGAPPELSPEGEAQNARRAAAQQRFAELQTEFHQIVQAAEADARTCESKINDAKDDSVKDNWWERNAGWLKGLATVLGAIAAVAGIILLTVATAGTIWLVVAVVAGIAALLINLGLAIKADGSWVDVAFDAIGLLTLGCRLGDWAKHPGRLEGHVDGGGCREVDEGIRRCRRWCVLLPLRRPHCRSPCEGPRLEGARPTALRHEDGGGLPCRRHRRCAWSRPGGLARHNDRAAKQHGGPHLVGWCRRGGARAPGSSVPG